MRRYVIPAETKIPRHNDTDGSGGRGWALATNKSIDVPTGSALFQSRRPRYFCTGKKQVVELAVILVHTHVPPLWFTCTFPTFLLRTRYIHSKCTYPVDYHSNYSAVVES